MVIDYWENDVIAVRLTQEGEVYIRYVVTVIDADTRETVGKVEFINPSDAEDYFNRCIDHAI